MTLKEADITQIAGGGQEHNRRSPRETLVTPALLWRSGVADQGTAVRVFVMNISLDGIAFRACTSFEPGKTHFLRLVVGPMRLEGLIRIAWCRPHTDKTFDTGAQFIDVR